MGVSHEARGFVAPAGRFGGGGGGCSGAAGDTPDGGRRGGRGRGRGLSGFRPSEDTPLVIDGVMYVATPYSRVVALDPISGKELWAFQLPSGSPSTRGVEFWAGDAKTPAQVVFGSSDGKLYSLNAKTGKPNDGFRRQRRRQPEYSGDHAGAARTQCADLAADRI